ncbi:hypothetical protein A2160_05690 [Candidatus Beckwithbacteria bacterium RBG_13_42_9]|uniref:Nucleoside 2-deoxyribosyltransferase n=1 Tax=Candidatus Beckwithbacteria bacterium RBG_13_42_9 TaxID=1797457 RepID=A0A1F5E616_9BACT|nr:MAG: hypothetical protein A2160_05690 [Candidatus Beckwithbacteria bacterium RBG_13_42_9]
MKVYFSTSARSKKPYKENIEAIYGTIEDLGYQHVTDFILRVEPENFYDRSAKDAAIFYNRMVNEIKKADICVFETSLESAGIGYSVNLALDAGKPVIALHLSDREPYLLKMINHPKIQVLEYTLPTLKGILKDALEIAKEQMDIRFTFFLTPKLVEYLDFIKRERKQARATFLRKLIDSALKKDKEFSEKNA